MIKKTQKKKYDTAVMSKALTGFALRVLVAGYIVFLAYKILSNMLGGSSSIPVWAVWLISGIFAAVAVVFCVYSFNALLKALKAAEITTVPVPEDAPAAEIGAVQEETDPDQEDLK